MCINFVFHKLNNIISFELSTLFDYFNLSLSHSLDICVPSITLINRTYSKSPWFNIEIVNPIQLFLRLQCKYASCKLESDIIAYKVFDRFTRKKLLYTKSSYFTDMLGSDGIYSKQAYKLSSTLVGKTYTKHLPDQSDIVICSLFTNYFSTKFLSLPMYFQTSTRYDSIST